MVKLKKKEIFKLNKNLNLKDLINDIADATVQDIQDGLNQGVDVNGAKFKRLKPATVKRKKKTGSATPSKPLLDKHKMKNVYVKTKATDGSLWAEIAINKRDRAVPSIVHNEGIGGMPKREWFGYSKRMDKKASKLALLHIQEALR